MGILRVEDPFEIASKVCLYKPRVGCPLDSPVRFTAEQQPVSHPQGTSFPIVAVFVETPCNINILFRRFKNEVGTMVPSHDRVRDTDDPAESQNDSVMLQRPSSVPKKNGTI